MARQAESVTDMAVAAIARQRVRSGDQWRQPVTAGDGGGMGHGAGFRPTAAARMRTRRGVADRGTLGLVMLGPGSGAGHLPRARAAGSGRVDVPSLRLVLLADLVYILVVAALVLREVARMIAARRAQSAGSRLHLRLTGVFTIVALVPTILVAVFATITVNMGLEGWFSDRVRNVRRQFGGAAVAYEEEHRDDLSEDARALAAFLDANRRAAPFLTDGELRQLLARGRARSSAACARPS
jgi:two-component system nitrogen regulation sensor histidine kinase NtrY